jgi:hypothetical protein
MTTEKITPGDRSPVFHLKRILKALASIKIAVITIALLACVTAWGTFVEAIYGDSAAAQKIVYHSIWMYSVMGLLAVNLIAVMYDRYPWKRERFGFVLAHIGLLILMTGAVVTGEFGLDGSVSIGIGESARKVIISNTDLTVYSSLDGTAYTKLFDREVDLFSNPPTEKKPIEVKIPNGAIKITDYYPYAFRDEKIVETKIESDGAAIRFQLQNPRVNMTEWLLQPAQGRQVVKDLGPAQVVFTSQPFVNIAGRNVIVLRPQTAAIGAEPKKSAAAAASDESNEAIEYEIHSAKDLKHIKRGVVHAGDTLETGWMGLVLRVLKFMPHAKQNVTFIATDAMTPLTVSAICVDYNGAKQWMSLDSMLKLFSDQAVYIVTYANRRLDLGFDIVLKKFEVGRYPGTMRAASYSSLVSVPELGERLIAMNEPLKFKGYTFYQASFSEDEQGRPQASVLSVNRDPGRWIKYLGSLIVVSGIIHLFYMRKKRK